MEPHCELWRQRCLELLQLIFPDPTLRLQAGITPLEEPIRTQLTRAQLGFLLHALEELHLGLQHQDSHLHDLMRGILALHELQRHLGIPPFSRDILLPA